MKRLAIPIALLLAGLLCSCARAERFGVWELERRLCVADKNYAFDTDTMFRKEGVYRQRLRFVSLTMTGTDADAAADFSVQACTLADVFLPEEARADARAALRLAAPDTFFRDETLTAAYGRYEAVFFKTTQGVSLMLQ